MRLATIALLLAAGCAPRAASRPDGEDFDFLLEDDAETRMTAEQPVDEADPAGRIDAWERAVLDPAGPATVERLRAATEATIATLEERLQEARRRSPYITVDERQDLVRRIAYEQERLARIEAKLR